MSVVEWMREMLGAVGTVFYALVGWIVVAPCAALVPKRRDWVAVIGREDGRFLDNTKYFFLQASTSDMAELRVVHVTCRQEVHDWVKGSGFLTLCYPSLAACWFLARCGTVVVDSIEWCESWRYFLLIRARKVQLWHGVGFKRIELDKWRHEAHGRRLMSSPWVLWARLLRKHLRGRIPCYDIVVTTSAFYRDNVFGPAFRNRHVLTSGYPRNGFGRMGGARADALARVNVDQEVLVHLADWQHLGRKIILVVPTFRDTRGTPLGLDAAQQERLNAFCETFGYEFLFKFHPYERAAEHVDGQHLRVLDANSDVYPLLPHVDAMVTDYSSIYMDYLLLDRPVLFLVPDLAEYVSRDRDMQFDFEDMAPGPKLDNWAALLDALRDTDDIWSAARARLRQLAFDDQPQTESTERLLAFMMEQGWLLPTRRLDNASQPHRL